MKLVFLCICLLIALPTHQGVESRASFSPDGSTIAFSAQYEEPTEVYTMPVTGGLPARLTYESGNASVVGWTPDGNIFYTTRHFSNLPNTRLGLGKVIGMRTWGGEIWLSFDNPLVDKGIASAAEIGVYSPERQWLIEGHGVDPDIVVDNMPHATFGGGDAQLDAAIKYLQEELQRSPVKVPEPPPYPVKTLKQKQ